jgi:hypothetical protein
LGLTKNAAETGNTRARELVDGIHASGTILTRVGSALIDVGLTQNA